MRYPRLMQDEQSKRWFIAGPDGPATWRYHRWYWVAVVELALHSPRAAAERVAVAVIGLMMFIAALRFLLRAAMGALP